MWHRQNVWETTKKIFTMFGKGLYFLGYALVVNWRCHIYSKDMPHLFQSYSKDMQQLFQRYATDMPLVSSYNYKYNLPL
jgi:hypothetical protein